MALAPSLEHHLERVDLGLQLREPGELHIEIAAVGAHLRFEIVNEHAEPPVRAPLAPQLYSECVC